MEEMWYDKIFDGIKAIGHKIKLGAVKHSPEIAFGIGITGVVVGFVYTVKKSMEPDDAVKTVITDIQLIKEHAENTPAGCDYTEEDYKEDVAITVVKAVPAIVWNYKIPIIAFVVAILAFGKAKAGEKARGLGATAVALGTAKSFNTYRERVRERFGPEVDYELIHGIEPPLITMTDCTEDNSTEATEPERAPTNTSETARWFDSYSTHFTKNLDENLLWLRMQEEQVNNILPIVQMMSYNQLAGRLDIPKMLDPVPGMKGVTKGDIIGWIYKKDVTHQIVFNVMSWYEYKKAYNPSTCDDDEMYVGEPEVHLDFNCCDILTDYIAA